MTTSLITPTQHWIDVADGHRVTLAGQVFTPPVAAAWLANYTYPRQRPTYPSMVGLYADIMREGKWRVSTLLLAEYTGAGDAVPVEPTPENPEPLAPSLFLLNGKNRLSAVVEAGVTLYFLIEHHQIDNEADLHELYGVQDRGRTRSVSDVFRSIGLDHEMQLSVGQLRMLGEAQPYIHNAFHPWMRQAIDPYRRAQFVRDWRSEGELFLHCLAGSRSKWRPYLTASPVTAVALATLRGAQEKAIAFWTAVAHDDGLRVGTPEKTLVDWIVDTRVRSMGEVDYARHIAAAWNAYYVGNPLEKLGVRAGTADQGINIVGTAFETRRTQRRRRGSNGDGLADDEREEDDGDA